MQFSANYQIHQASNLSLSISSLGGGGRRSNQVRVSAIASTMTTRSPTMYEVLSISHTARPEEIKAAYRTEARRWHPDTCRSPNGRQEYAEKFMLAKEAYEVLSDPNRKHAYDMLLMFGSEEMRAMDTRENFCDWKSQLERMNMRVRPEDTWASRMRRSRGWE